MRGGVTGSLSHASSTVPSDEHLVQHAHVAPSSSFGAVITCTTGIYCAELQAIARAIAMLPVL